MPQYKFLLEETDTSDDVPSYVTHKIAAPVKHFPEEQPDGEFYLISTQSTWYFDSDGNRLPQFDKLTRFENGEGYGKTIESMAELEEVVE